MAGSFRIAEGYVEVTADESNYDRAMARLTSNKHQVKVGIQLDDKDALARLGQIAKNRAVKIDVNLAGTAALAQLARDTKDRKVHITLDLDATTALAKLTQATRERAVKVRVDLDQTAMTRLTGRTYTAGVIAEINQAAYQRVQKALDKLTADRTVQIRATADTRVAADEIRNLIRRQQLRIGIDVDTRVAADSIANLTRRRTMTVAANANTTDARARLDLLTRDRRMNVRVDMDRTALSSLSSIGGAGAGGGGLGSLAGSLSSLTAAAIGALPTIASLGQSLVAMAPAAALAAPAVLGLASAFAAIKIGTSGIGDAFKAAFAPAASSASTALSATKAVEAAQRSLAKAQQGVKDAEVSAAAARVAAARQIRDAQLNLKNTVSDVADANRRAAESVAQAEQDLANAQRDARQAQLDLTQARKDAAAELEDLNNRLVDAHLGERDAVLRVQDAQQNLDAVKAKGAAATQEEKDKAQLEYDKAVQALKEQQTETKRLEDQAAAANKAGVEGSDKVAKAKQGVADANQTAADKAKALKDAEIQAARTTIDGTQKIAKAERDLADARAAATKAAVDGARSIADAQAAVADAARAVADAQTSATLKTNTLGQAMAKLSTNAREFVNAVIAQRGAWTALKLDVQDRLFRGLGSTFTTMTRAALPSLRTGLVGTAGVLNAMAKNAANAVTQLGKTGALKKLFEGLNGGLKPLSKVPGQFITGLTQISIAAAPAFKRITTAAGGFADRLSKQLTQAFKNGHLEKVIDQALNIAVQFGKLIGNIFGTLGNVMKAAAKGGGDALGALGELFKTLRKVTAMPEMQKAMTSIFTAINAIAKAFAGTVGKVVVQLFEAFAQIAPTITKVVGSLGNIAPLLGGILLATNPVLGAFVLLAPILGKLAKPIASLIASMGPLLTMLSDFASGLMSSLAPVIGSVIGVLAAVFKALAPVVKVVLGVVSTLVATLATALVPVINALIPVVGLVGQLFMQLAPIWQQLVLSLLPLLPPISELAVALVNLAVQVLTPLMPLIVGLAGALAGTLAGAIGVLVPVITTVIGWITKFADAMSASVKWVVAQFQWMYDALVGHSIIPDLVKAIISWFSQLWTRTKQIFDGLRKDVIAIWGNLWSKLSSAWSGFWNGLRNSLSGAGTSMRTTFNSLRTGLSNTWSGLWNGVKNTFSSIMNSVSSKIGSFSSGTKTAFSNLRNALGTIWNGIRSKFSSPIKFVIGSVYNDGIRKMWNAVASKISSKITLPAIKLGFNSGGIVPGAGTRDTVPAMLTPGERVLSLAQVAKLGGHQAIDQAVGHGTGKGPFFAGGGVIGSIVSGVGGALSGAWDWTKNLVRGGLADAAQAAIKGVVQPLINHIPMGSGQFSSMIKGLPKAALNNMLGFLRSDDKQYQDTAFAKIGNVSEALKGWIAAALAITKTSPSWASGLATLVMRESGGNPRAMNAWDSNAAQGYDMRSKGLAQTIGPTFRANHQPGTSSDIFDPVANLSAAINYIKHRYGDISRVQQANPNLPPKGYDSGGLLAPGATLAVNRTGKPEAVLNPDDRAKFEALVRNGRAGMTMTFGDIVIKDGSLATPASRKAAANAMVAEMKEALRQFDKDRR